MTSRSATSRLPRFIRLCVVAAHCAAFAFVGVDSSEAADECQVSYTYLQGSGPSAVPQVVQTQVSANAMKTIDQGAMRYVVNDRDWPVDVEVTTLPAGTKWVHLVKKGDRDPANGNYVGNIELRKVKCLPGGTSGGSQSSTAPAVTLALVKTFFTGVSVPTSPTIGELIAWRAEAQAAAAKAAANVLSCPSPAAQTAYDELKRKRAQLVHVQEVIKAERTDASQALSACQQGTGSSSMCATEYSNLTSLLTGLDTAASVYIQDVDRALVAMRNLTCTSPASGKPASLVARP